MVKWKTEAAVGGFWGEGVLRRSRCLMLFWWIFPSRGHVLMLLGGTGCASTEIGLLLICLEVGIQAAGNFWETKHILEFFICCTWCVQPPREYSCIYTLRLKSKPVQKIEVLFLLWKQWRLQGEKHSRKMRRFKLVFQVVLASQQQPRFSPSSRHFGSTAKCQSPRNCKFTPVGFHFSSSGKGGRGAKTDGSCQPAQKWDASGGVLFMEMFRSNNHRNSLISVGEGEFGSYGPILPFFKHLL